MKKIGVAIIFMVIASIFDRIYYAQYLHDNGLQNKDLVLPMKLIIDYYCSFPGHLFLLLMIAPFLLLGIIHKISNKSDTLTSDY